MEGTKLYTLEGGDISDMSQSTATLPATSVPGSPSSAPPPSPTAASPFLGEAVIPLVNKLQDIFSQLGSASTIDLPQVSVLVYSVFIDGAVRF